MKRLWGSAAFLAVLVCIGTSSAEADKEPTLKEIMKKCNGGPKGLCALIGAGLKGDKPSWDDLQKEAKDLVECSSFLPKTKAPKGDQESYEKLAKGYVDIAKDLQSAVDKKEQKDAVTAQKKLAGTCKACHESHRPAKQ
jgi:cytochrome c556